MADEGVNGAPQRLIGMRTETLPVVLPLYSSSLPATLAQLDDCFQRLSAAVKTEKPGYQAYFRVFFERRIQLLAATSPFAGIRERCASFLADVDSPLSLGGELMEASAYLPRTLIEEFQSALEEEERDMLRRSVEDIFLTIGRVPNYEVLLSSHPRYLEQHSELLSALFTSESMLPGHWKYYLAFMSAACNQCEYFMSLERELCCLSGGNSEWFDAATLEQLPQKIRDLGIINGILAHRPWELTTEDLRSLLSAWSVGELVEILVILCVFHSLSSLVLGLGVLPEYDLPSPRRRKSSISSVLDSLHRAEVASQLLIESRTLFEPMGDEDASEYFEAMAGCSLAFTNYAGQGVRLYPSDFNWRDHGYAMLEKLLPDVAARLNAPNAYAYRLAMDSARWRAAWLYIQRLYGLEYDDYNYREVNTELAKSTKAFLKKVACLPHEVRLEDWREVALSPQEKVELVLIVCEARREGELLYALHALRSLL